MPERKVAELDMADRVDALIARFHPHLEDCRLVVLWRDKAAKHGDTVSLASTSVLSEKNRTATDIDAVIEVAEDTWADLTGEQREALLDHELAHIGVKEDESGSVVGYRKRNHEVEGFADVMARRGPGPRGSGGCGKP